jgi:hypothetical protein
MVLSTKKCFINNSVIMNVVLICLFFPFKNIQELGADVHMCIQLKWMKFI